MSAPRISVIVPNYNHAAYLPRCLDALLFKQTAPPFEVIVIDDASKDNSVSILEDYARRSPILRPIRNPQNLGVIATLNRGLELAIGDYVSFPAADDEVLPPFIEASLRMLIAHPKAGACTGRTEWRCQSTGLTWIHGTAMPDGARFFSPPELVERAKAGRLELSGQNMIYRKDALVAAGRWIPELRWFADAFGAWVVTFRDGVCWVPEVLSVYNLFPTSYHNAAQAETRREVMRHLLLLLESPGYADVAPPIREGGQLGGFGPMMLRLVLTQRRHHHLLTPAFARQMARRTSEIVGRRFFPQGLARLALRLFYGRKPRG